MISSAPTHRPRHRRNPRSSLDGFARRTPDSTGSLPRQQPENGRTRRQLRSEGVHSENHPLPKFLRHGIPVVLSPTTPRCSIRRCRPNTKTRLAWDFRKMNLPACRDRFPIRVFARRRKAPLLSHPKACYTEQMKAHVWSCQSAPSSSARANHSARPLRPRLCRSEGRSPGKFLS